MLESLEQAGQDLEGTINTKQNKTLKGMNKGGFRTGRIGVGSMWRQKAL